MKVGSPGTATTLSVPGYTVGDTSITVGSTSNWSTDTGVAFAIDQAQVVNGVEVQVPGTYNEYVGTVASGTSVSNVSWVTGSGDKNYSAGALTRVYIPVSATRENRIVDWGLVHANQDGTLKTTAVQAALNISAAVPSDYTTLAQTATTVVPNGNRSYTLTFPGVNYTDRLSPGMRLRTVRSATAPTQSASLNGTNQYFSKTSPAGMTFTDDFVVSAWVKLSSYPSVIAPIVARTNDVSGWELRVDSSGQIRLIGMNASNTNTSYVTTYQSIPLNKWVHITAQLDMSAFTASSTTSYIMLDGVDVPVSIGRTGTNPTSIIQAGNLEVGGRNGGSYVFPGKIAQVAIFNAKVTQATMRGYISQGLSGTEPSLISAYSFNNSITDLNTTNANNLTANGGALATNTDSPFGIQGDGTISTTVDYGVIQKATYLAPDTTVVVQTPEGGTIPTSGGVASVSYSQFKSPYGFPGQKSKWSIVEFLKASSGIGISGYSTKLDLPSVRITAPVGSWRLSLRGVIAQDNSAGGSIATYVWLSLGQAGDEIQGTKTYVEFQSTTLNQYATVFSATDLETTSSTTIYGVVFTVTGGGSVAGGLRGDITPSTIELENAYL